jgi:hypothetical protein
VPVPVPRGTRAVRLGRPGNRDDLRFRAAVLERDGRAARVAAPADLHHHRDALTRRQRARVAAQADLVRRRHAGRPADRAARRGERDLPGVAGTEDNGAGRQLQRARHGLRRARAASGRPRARSLIRRQRLGGGGHGLVLATLGADQRGQRGQPGPGRAVARAARGGTVPDRGRRARAGRMLRGPGDAPRGSGGGHAPGRVVPARPRRGDHRGHHDGRDDHPGAGDQQPVPVHPARPRSLLGGRA